MLSLDECSLCRLYLTDVLLDNAGDGMVESVYRFCRAFNRVAYLHSISLEDAVERVLVELHEEHNA